MIKSSLRIAAVEDDPKQFNLVKRVLEKEPLRHILSHFTSGEEFLKKPLSEEYDLILLDYKLPGMNGVEIIKEIRRQKPFLPIILVSAFGTEKNVAEALEKGADDYLIKDSGGNYLKILNLIITKTMKKAELQLENEKLQQEMLYSQKMQLISTLARGIAHDFNNALVGIIGYADLLKLKVEKNEEASFYIDRIYTSARRMAVWIKQLLAYSRAEEHKLQPLSFNVVIRKCIQMIEPSLEKRIQVFTNLSQNLQKINGDKNQIEQIVTNVLLNAIEAISGHGEIRISTEQVTNPHFYQLGSIKKATGDFVHVIIEDTGIGMDKDTMARIFEPFFSTKFVGRGLGMAAVYGIVDHHNGFITLDSELGKGTKVDFYFPSADESIKLNELDSKTDAKKKKILVIDDEAVTLEIINKVFSEKGYTVIEARDGFEGLELFKENKDVLLIILDLVMPKKDGIEIFHEIKKINPDQKILICSGFDKKQIQNLMEKGASGFVLKPFTIEEIVFKTETILGKLS
jgi:two-component system, cell cycle sensor histidine kinase and response regulator CckA